MRGYITIALIAFCAVLVSCNKSTAPGPHATVLMRDGTQYAGTVTSTTPTEVTLNGDDHATHTLAMKDVKSIEYDDASQPAETAQAPEGTKPGTRHARRERSHDDHYHPEQAAVTTKTYEVPAGAEVSVRSEETIDSGRATEGQTYAAEVTNDVQDTNGDVVIPRGANSQIVI